MKLLAVLSLGTRLPIHALRTYCVGRKGGEHLQQRKSSHWEDGSNVVLQAHQSFCPNNITALLSAANAKTHETSACEKSSLNNITSGEGSYTLTLFLARWLVAMATNPQC